MRWWRILQRRFGYIPKAMRIPRDAYPRFTDRALRVLAIANEVANGHGHKQIGNEHILLGIVILGRGAGVNVLKIMDVRPGELARHINALAMQDEPGTLRQLPCDPPGQHVTDRASQESARLDHNYVGTEHLLLAAIQPENSIPAIALRELGITPSDVRAEVFYILDGDLNSPAPR